MSKRSYADQHSGDIASPGLHASVAADRDTLAAYVAAHVNGADALISLAMAHVDDSAADFRACVIVGPGWSARPARRAAPAPLPPDATPISDGGMTVVAVVGVVGTTEPLALLARVFDLLRDHGTCIVLDRFRRPTRSMSVHPLPLADHFVNQARRAGLDPVERRELAAPSDVETGALLVFRRGAPSRWRILPSRPEDHPAIRRLFAESFGAEMSEELWHWKYADGRGAGVVAWRDGEIIGHLGGFSRAVAWHGERMQTLQLGDAMIRKDRRGTTVYRDIAATTGETAAGFGNPHPVAYGWVFERQSRLLDRWRMAAPVTHLEEITWPARTPSRLTGLTATQLSLPRDRKAVDELWMAMERGLSHVMLGVRDAAYVMHRYLQHPAIAYDVVLIRRRFTRRPLGLVVLKMEESRAVLVDIVAPLDRVPSMLSHARGLAAQAGKTELMCWINAAQAPLFSAAPDAVRKALDVHVILNAWSEGPRDAARGDAWWLMMGDTDYL